MSSWAPGLHYVRSAAVTLACAACVLAGCASDARFLWEEYTNAGLGAYRAGRYGRAEMFLTRAAQKAEELGPVELGRSLNNLGELNRRRGNAAEAEQLFQRALTVKQTGLGAEHPSVATTLNNLAQIYVDQGRDADAAGALERSLRIQEKVLDPEHPVLRRTLTLLAEVYRHLGRDDDAFILEVRTRMLRDATPPSR